jgi:HEXXH motif-containing protein
MKLFMPQPASDIADLDAKIRRKLAASLEHIFERTGRSLGIERGECDRVLSSIAARRQKPSVFACYFELVLALKAGRTEEAAHIWSQLAFAAGEAAAFAIAPLTDEAMGEDAERFTRLLNASEKGPIFTAPDPAQWPAFEANVAVAFSILERADDALGAEVRALIAQLIGSAANDPALSFGSVSSLTLWGAVALNVEIHRRPLDIADSLVHESAHLLLFGYAGDEMLVRNPLSERFASPLRSDPRPMIGVFHATFVCARLHYFYRRLLDSRLIALAAGERREIEGRMAQMVGKFEDSAQLIADHAILTPVGEEVMRATAAYMSYAAAA